MGKPALRGAIDRESLERLIDQGAIVFSLRRNSNGCRQIAAQQQQSCDQGPQSAVDDA